MDLTGLKLIVGRALFLVVALGENLFLAFSRF